MFLIKIKRIKNLHNFVSAFFLKYKIRYWKIYFGKEFSELKIKMGNGATRTDLQYKEYLKYLEVILFYESRTKTFYIFNKSFL